MRATHTKWNRHYISDCSSSNVNSISNEPFVDKYLENTVPPDCSLIRYWKFSQNDCMHWPYKPVHNESVFLNWWILWRYNRNVKLPQLVSLAVLHAVLVWMSSWSWIGENIQGFGLLPRKGILKGSINLELYALSNNSGPGDFETGSSNDSSCISWNYISGLFNKRWIGVNLMFQRTSMDSPRSCTSRTQKRFLELLYYINFPGTSRDVSFVQFDIGTI